MSKLSSQSHIKQQANAWISSLNRGLTDEEKPQLIAWMNQSQHHHKALYKSATFFDNMSELKTLNGIFPIDGNQQTLAKAIKTFFLLIPLCLILVFIASSIMHAKQDSSPIYFQTQIGERGEFLLDDGTVVILNTHSKIAVNYSQSHRKINLISGEGQFNVAKDRSRPFIVTSGTTSFTALGTIFNVQKNNNLNVDLLVTEGEVLVTDNKDADLLNKIIVEETSKQNSPLIITHGEQVKIVNAVQQATFSLSPTEIDKELSWQNGVLIFTGESLRDALNEVSRYTDVQFEITTPKIGDVKISGYFKAGDINGLLQTLQRNFDIQYKYNATNSIQLSSKFNLS